MPLVPVKPTAANLGCKLILDTVWAVVKTRTGLDRPEVVISVSTCREIAYLDREVAIASSHCGIALCREVREQFSLASWLYFEAMKR